MSRSEMALLPHVLPTASQVLTTDLKITNAEANIFNLLADMVFKQLRALCHQRRGIAADGGSSPIVGDTFSREL